MMNLIENEVTMRNVFGGGDIIVRIERCDGGKCLAHGCQAIGVVRIERYDEFSRRKTIDYRCQEHLRLSGDPLLGWVCHGGKEVWVVKTHKFYVDNVKDVIQNAEVK